MGLENVFSIYEIRQTLCEFPDYRTHQPKADIQKDIIEFVFGSRIALQNISPRSPLGLRSFVPLSEDKHFDYLASKDERVLNLANDIKNIYIDKIINKKNLSSSELIDRHMNELVRILFDPYQSADEFCTRAVSLKENLLNLHRTYVSEEILFPEYCREQRMIDTEKNRQFELYKKYSKGVPKEKFSSENFKKSNITKIAKINNKHNLQEYKAYEKCKKVA